MVLTKKERDPGSTEEMPVDGSNTPVVENR